MNKPCDWPASRLSGTFNVLFKFVVITPCKSVVEGKKQRYRAAHT